MNCKCALGSFCFSAKGQIANCPNRSIVASLATVCRRPFFLATFFLEKRRNICARQTALSSNTVLHSSAKVVTQETSNFYSSLAHLINSVSSKKYVKSVKRNQFENRNFGACVTILQKTTQYSTTI